MLVSMTGYGNGTASREGLTACAEIRSVNNRFFEFSARVPKHLQTKEGELKEMVRRKAQRGKVNLTVTVEHEGNESVGPKVNVTAAKQYWRMLQELADSVGSTAPISLDTLFKFSEVLAPDESTALDEVEWQLVTEAVTAAADMLAGMRTKEGRELTADLLQRCTTMTATIDSVETLSRERIGIVRDKLRERISQLLESDKVDESRLELEIVLLADKSDITEEVVRFRSHMKFFGEALNGDESEGRKLSFLLQELNREANTISAKSNDAAISQQVVSIKEELERIREQIQNIE
jgi:uncharacterized protein (TIGR00255 family)